MRVTTIKLLSNDIEAIRFDLRAVAAKSQYIIRNIVGLDADDLVPRFYGFSKDGAKRFYEFKPKPKDIVMRIVVNPRYNLDETNSDIRDNLYKLISATRTGLVDLEFLGGASTVARISGHIIKFEVPYFSNEPELQITIRCNDAMFRGINPVSFEADDISSTNPLVFGDSISTAPHGFSMQVTLTGTLSNFTIQDKATDPEWDFKVIPSSNFLSGDTIHFSSEFNNRYLYMVRSAVTTHLLDRIETTSVWPLVFPGRNELHFPDIASFDWDFISFYPAFWGV